MQLRKPSTSSSFKKLWYVLSCAALTILLTQVPGCIKHDDNPMLDLKVIAGNFVSPLSVVEAPDGSHRLFVVDQIGKIWIIDKDGNRLSTPFLDVSSKITSLNPQYDERGLLSLAFHPNFKFNGRFFVFYTAPPVSGAFNNTNRISEFKVVSNNPNRADINSERIILEVNHPQFNHNGGTIAFGPDDFLYISIGDGGNKDDVGPGHVEDWYKVNKGGNGQDVKANLLGNVLRIDIDQNTKGSYGIPSDNPFVGKPGLDEIYAYGFRNPYRFSFDMGPSHNFSFEKSGEHKLFLGDAGQSLYEEVDAVKKGGNYGWNVKEGTHCFSTDNDLQVRPNCPDVDSAGNPLIDPIIELENSENPNGQGISIAVIGGNVYRGHSIPSLDGKYIFGSLSGDEDKATGKLFKANPEGDGLRPFSALSLKSFPNNLGQYLKGFGQDLSGELYVITSGQIGPQGTTGKVYKLVEVR